jgi:hypothetical protein
MKVLFILHQSGVDFALQSRLLTTFCVVVAMQALAGAMMDQVSRRVFFRDISAYGSEWKCTCVDS